MCIRDRYTLVFFDDSYLDSKNVFKKKTKFNNDVSEDNEQIVYITGKENGIFLISDSVTQKRRWRIEQLTKET